MKKLLVLAVIVAGLFTVSCTENIRARHWGGTENIQLESGNRVVNVTWKEGNVWILTKQDATTKPTVYTFAEKSNWGVMQGSIVIVEN